MSKYLAADIGGSKSRFVVFDEQRTEIDSVKIPGFGLAYDSEEDLPLLRKTLSDLAQKHAISSVAVNLGGKNKKQIAAIVKACFPNIPMSVYRESEAAAALAFGKLYGAQVVLLAGTGTIAAACLLSGEQIVSGGWGVNIGDDGSGYDIGLQAIKRSLSALDQGKPLTAMQKEITGRMSPILPACDVGSVCALRDAVRDHISPLDRKHVASFAKIVVHHAENGEQDALEILTDAGKHMGVLTANCANKLLPHEIKKAAVSGGLVSCRKFWQEAFENTVKARSAVREFVYVRDGVLSGTMELAIQQCK